MKLRKVLTGLLMMLIPVFGFAQGKGKGQGKGNGQGNAGGKPAKAAKANQGNQNVNKNKAVKVNQGNPNVNKNKAVKVNNNKSVKVRNQQTGVYTGNRTKGGPPPWAPAHGYRAKQHVYFPDYRVFYDPNRGGYSYWQNNSWAFSPSIPGFLSGVNLGKARIQLLGDVPLTSRPETYYNRYSQMYPARSVNITVPIPGR